MHALVAVNVELNEPLTQPRATDVPVVLQLRDQRQDAVRKGVLPSPDSGQPEDRLGRPHTVGDLELNLERLERALKREEPEEE